MITPVLLCGGSGTRLWPLSRKSYPKQFVPLLDRETLFQTTAKRLSGPEFSAPLVLTNADFRFIVTQQLTEAGLDPGAVLIEPEGRNTAPAVLAAALWLHAQDPDALMLVAPSDHVIADETAFHDAVTTGRRAAQADQIVTFGIPPTRPETGYGYLALGDIPEPGTSQALKGFVEKPDPEQAARMLAAGKFLWNAGIFLFSVRTILAAFEQHAPDLLDPVRVAVTQARSDLGFLRLAPAPWTRARNISIDYAVMEPADNLDVVPLDAGWSDLGDWDAVWRETTQGAASQTPGLASYGSVTALDCTDTLLHAEEPGQELVGLGLKDIVAVAMPDAVLVADRSRAQDVKAVVAALKSRNLPQAEHFPKAHRPWGWSERLLSGDRFQVNRVVLHPGAIMGLQSHRHRAEHWIVVEGQARVTLKDRLHELQPNESLYIPQGARHRLENAGTDSMVLIEVQTGAYLGEDDVTRHEDIYGGF